MQRIWTKWWRLYFPPLCLSSSFLLVLICLRLLSLSHLLPFLPPLRPRCLASPWLLSSDSFSLGGICQSCAYRSQNKRISFVFQRFLTPHRPWFWVSGQERLIWSCLLYVKEVRIREEFISSIYLIEISTQSSRLAARDHNGNSVHSGVQWGRLGEWGLNFAVGSTEFSPRVYRLD